MGLIVRLENALIEQSCSKSTIACYSFWARHLYRFCRKPGSQWTGADVRAWLLSLYQEKYSPVSRKQALNAAAFIFRHVLKADMGKLDLPPMPRVRQTLRIIPSRDELRRIFDQLTGQVRLMAWILYGSGPRVMECCTLRVKDVDIDHLMLEIWGGKGDKCRRTVFPESLIPFIQRQIAWRKSLHELDLAAGNGLVELPGRLAFKYKNANRQFAWQYLFPSAIVRDHYRWHTVDEAIAKQLRTALRKLGIAKRVTPHTLRHAFATHAMEIGNDPRTVQGWLGHENIQTTMIYWHANSAHGISPVDCQLPAIDLQRLRMGQVRHAIAYSPDHDVNMKALQEAMGHADVETTSEHCDAEVLSEPTPLDARPICH